MCVVGQVPGRTGEALSTVNKLPFSLPGPGTSLLSKSSQLRWQLIPLRGAMLFSLPSSASVVILLVVGLLYSLQEELPSRFCNS